VQPRTYEITFAGQAGALLRAEFDDCEISVGPGTTTLRAELPDQGGLQGLLQRIASLRLELIHLHLVAAPPNDRSRKPGLPGSSASGQHPSRIFCPHPPMQDGYVASHSRPTPVTQSGQLLGQHLVA
jgi:hypothetical protein